MQRLKKKYYILGSIGLIIFLFFFFLSTIIKNYITKNSKELLGRKLTIKELHINYINVSLKIKNFILYEENNTDTFFYFKELLVNYDPWKMLHDEYAVSELKLERPYIHITQDGEKFNFDSLIPNKRKIHH